MRQEGRIRCIALDLDGTTLDGDGRLSKRNRRAIEAALEQGIHVVVASGRPYASLPEEVLEIPGLRYAVTSNGAVIYDLEQGTILREYQLDEAAVETVLRATEDAQVAYETFIRGIPYAQAAYVEDPVRFGAPERAVPYIQRTRRPIEDIRNFIRDHSKELDSIDVIVQEGEQKQRLWTLLEEKVGNVYITSSVPQLLEISHRESGKASAVRCLLEHLGLERGELAAFGDGENDRELLEFAGIGIAVENASPGCLAAADRVARAHDEDGVGEEIEQLLGNEE